MMDKIKGINKKTLAGVLAAVIAVGAVWGITAAVRATTASAVPVVRVSDLNYGSFMDWQNSVSGIVTTEAEQNIYLSDTEKVQEVLVTEGQAVHKGDVLLRYDTRGTMLSLEKEKLNRERIELEITVAKENIRILENASPVSEGGDFSFVADFAEIDPAQVLSKAQVYEKILTADAKPVSEDSEFEILGTEDSPYVFLCKGNSVTLTKEFIKKWQKEAAGKGFKQLYIELASRDSAQNLLKAWITDVMLLDPGYDIEVDLATGKAGYAAMNNPEELAALLRKVLIDVPQDEQGAWLAAMMDKLMILTEQEDADAEAKKGELLAAMFNELGKEEQANLADEFAAAVTMLDARTLSVLFRSLSENLTQEQVDGIDPEARAQMLALLLAEMDQEQIQALDPEVLGNLFAGFSREQIEALDAEEMREFFTYLTQEQLEILVQERGDEIKPILDKILSESGSQTGEGTGGGQGGSDAPGDQSGSDASGGQSGQENPGGGESGSGQTDPAPPDAGSEPQPDPSEPDDPPQEEPSGQEPATSEPAENGESGAEQSAPATASSPSGPSQILSEDISYTSDELAKARREARDKLRDLELNHRESEIRIDKAQNALDKGVITANMNGVVKAAGDPQSPPTDGSAFITVSGSEGLYVRSGIKESKLGTIVEGDHVYVTSWQTGTRYEAEIKSISPYPDSTGMFDDGGTQTYYPFTANVLDKDAVLQNGEWVEVSYSAGSGSADTGTGTLTILKAFVREEGSRKYVYVRDENNTLRKQYIVTGTLSDTGYEVIDGISESDWIAFPYGKNVREGAKTREASIGELYE